MNEENRFEIKIEFKNEDAKRKFKLQCKRLVIVVCIVAFALIVAKMLF